MKSDAINFNVKIKLVGFGRQKIGLWIIAFFAKIFNIECEVSARTEREKKTKIKKGKFAFRLWFIKVLIESLMKSKIDEYVKCTIVARRTKKTLTEGYTITDSLIDCLASTHDEISELEKSWSSDLANR